jgi:hypothetical protein
VTYSQRWLLAVALKQPYPQLETGAEEPPPNPIPPPEFSAEELAPAAKEYREAEKRKSLWTGLALGAIGAVLIDRLFVHGMLKI